MTTNRSDDEFLRDLFKELDRKVEAGNLRLEAKLDNLRDTFSSKISQTEEKLSDHEQRIIKGEHTIKTAAYIFTPIITVFTGVCTWFMTSFFPPHK